MGTRSILPMASPAISISMMTLSMSCCSSERSTTSGNEQAALSTPRPSRGGRRAYHGILVGRGHKTCPLSLDLVDEMERTGWMARIFAGDFNGFVHRPDELRAEVAAAELRLRS